MEPKLPTPDFQPEKPPVLPEQTAERTDVIVRPEAVAERGEQRREANQVAVPVLPPPVVPAVPQPKDDSAQPAADSASDDTPLVAKDDDLIEKEWVDKAKRIITETKDDPYRREQEVGKLQADYLRKRYGKELGVTS